MGVGWGNTLNTQKTRLRPVLRSSCVFDSLQTTNKNVDIVGMTRF